MLLARPRATPVHVDTRPTARRDPRFVRGSRENPCASEAEAALIMAVAA